MSMKLYTTVVTPGPWLGVIIIGTACSCIDIKALLNSWSGHDIPKTQDNSLGNSDQIHFNQWQDAPAKIDGPIKSTGWCKVTIFAGNILKVFPIRIDHFFILKKKKCNSVAVENFWNLYMCLFISKFCSMKHWLQIGQAMILHTLKLVR